MVYTTKYNLPKPPRPISGEPIYERVARNVENDKMMYFNQPVLGVDKEGKPYLESFSEWVNEGFCENPSRASSTTTIAKEEEEEKTIIPRANDIRANTYTKFTLLINRYLYKWVMRSIGKKIKSAVRQRKGWVRLDGDNWRLVKFPELIDRLKYLGYRVKKTWINGYYIFWDDQEFKEGPGEEI